MEPSEDDVLNAGVLRELAEQAYILYGVTKLINPTSESLVSAYLILKNGKKPIGLYSVTARVAKLLGLPYHAQWDAVQVPSEKGEAIFWLAGKVSEALGLSAYLNGAEL